MIDLVPLTGEPLALDLVNTRPRTPDGPVDLIATAEGLRAWLGLQAGRLAGALPEDGQAPLTDDDLAAAVSAVHDVRGHAADAIDRVRRGLRPPEDALRGLNSAQRAAPAVRALAWNGAAVTAVPRRDGPPGARLSAVLAEAVAELLTDPAVTTVRECAADDCVMLFLPAHPRRRWCSAARCGNRARVARHYRRHRAPDSDL
ncbi:ABATE domain-containing protein [Microbispora sp. NEAU-D428]|uniref:CGNR zinc finger domain-containing protein n=1 Tax=Microbispora sitophila TaxID=2771537 RepID=UPI0018686DBA|nr:ABATE domain-containing protein [Microbispora sitophila]MBE3014272.1 ABATE domain-containing protein [Microbispora sitophila]